MGVKILNNFFQRFKYSKNKINMRSNFFLFFLYFSIAAIIGIFVRDIPGQADLFSTIQNFTGPTEFFKAGDPYSFASGALDIYHHGWLQPDKYWLVELWPPGFMVTEGIILKVFGINAPFILILIILNSILVALLLLVMRHNLLAVTPPFFAALLPLAPFLFPVSRLFLLQPAGMVFGESFSIILFMISVFLAPIAIRNRSRKTAVLSGFILALSTYYRSQFELFINFLTLLFILIGLAYFFFLKMRMHESERRHMRSVISTLGIVLFVTHAVMIPWRIHNLHTAGNMSWVQTKTLTYAHAGRTDQELIEAGGGWIVQGRGNVACKVEPSYCGTKKGRAFYKAFINHPIDWFLYKYEVAGGYWFASLEDFGPIIFPATTGDFITNGLILFIVFFNLFLLLRIWRHPDFAVYAWQCISFYAGCFGVFMLVHFETRYFYALKIYAIFLFILLSAIAWRLSRTNHTALPSEL